MPDAPVHLLDSKWRIAKQLRNVPQWPGIIEVTKLEFDDTTGNGIVHVQAQPNGWSIRLSLESFNRVVNQGGLLPA